MNANHNLFPAMMRLFLCCDSICKYNKMNANHNLIIIMLAAWIAVILSANIIK